MDAASLFQALTSRPEAPASNIITGTAVGSSEDGVVLVQVDGSAVAQPSDEEVTLTIPTDEFAGGTYQLPSAPYPGTIVLTDDNDNVVDEDDYYVDGDQLTIEALDLPPVEIAYDTEVRQALTNEDFASGSITVDSTTNLTLLEDMGGADWQPAAYTLDGNELSVAGIDVQQGLVEFVYVRSVSLVCAEGLNVLPDMPDPDDVAVTGRLNNTDYVVTSWTLDQDQLTLPSGYDAFVVDYIINETEQWNISEQYLDEPLQDSDEAADPAIITVGHDLQYEPDTVTSCTVDGVSATYTLDGVNVVADSPAVTERYFTLTYDMPVTLEVPASEFAVSSYTLPSEPTGAVTTTSNGSTLANSVSGLELSIPSLIATSASYTIAYTAQAETDVVELPCTPAVSEGQFVDIAIVNGMPTVIGASGSGDAVAAAADAAETAAQAAQTVANAVNQHFWTDGSGVHVTEVTQEEWLDPLSPNYQSGANQLSNSAGILLRDGLTNFAQLTPGETAFYDGAGNDASNVVASFGASGGFIGQQSSGSYAAIDSDSFDVIHGGVEVAHLGYGEGTDSGGTLANAPYFTLGKRYSADSGTYSSASTYDVGSRVTYNGENYICKVAVTAPEAWDSNKWQPLIGNYSLVAGNGGAASGEGAIALGQSIAIGRNSAALGLGTTATRLGSLVAGRYNDEDAAINYLFVIGNGTDNVARSDAFTVDTAGNAWAAGNAIAQNMGGAAYASDLNSLTVPGIYYCTTASTNGPVASTAGQCVVAANASQANVVQVFTTFGSTPAVYARRYNSGVWDAWHLVGSEVTTSSPTLTNASATTFQLRKDGSTVNLMVYGLNVSSSLSSGSSVSLGSGLVPAGYRPSTYVYAPCVVNNSTNATGLFFYITSGGNVSLYNRSGSSLGTTTNVNCTISWVV